MPYLQQILQEAYILGTGHGANAKGIAWAEGLVSVSGDYETVAAVVNDYMDNLAREQGVVATVQAIAKNGHGISLSDTQTTQLIADLTDQGIDTWAKLFEFSINLQNAAGTTLDNRARAATEFLSSLEEADKADYFTGPGVDGAVKTLLQNITSSTISLANGTSGLDTLVNNLTETGITGLVFGVGYITGATVFADANGDGVQNVGEWTTTTDGDGKFELPNDIIAGRIIASVGTGLMTGNVFRGVFSSPVGSTALNTFTTLIETMVTNGQAATVADATAALRSALDLPLNINLLSYDPLAILASSTTTDVEKAMALTVQARAQQITNILTHTEAVIVATTGHNVSNKRIEATDTVSAPTTEESASLLVAFAAVADALASAITSIADTAAILDLTSAGILDGIIQQAVAATGSSFTVEQAGQLAQLTAASNTSVGTAVNITELSQAVTVSLGIATTALIAGAARGNIDSAVSAFTGAALEAANRAATVGYIDAVVPVPPPPTPSEASDTTAPSASIVVDDTALNEGDTSLVTITFTEAVNGFSNADLVIAHGTLTNVASADGGVTWSATFTPTEGTTSRSNVITLASAGVTDAAGNAGVGITNSNSYAIDTRPPAIAFNTIATDSTINAAEVGALISGTNEALATVSLSIGGTTRAATVSGATWTYTLVAADIINMGQGAETLTATTTGTAGNTASASRTITVDTLSPVVGINAIATDDIINAAESNGVISGTNEAGATVRLNLGGVIRTAIVSGTTWSYTLVAADITTMGQGSETIAATVTDAAGNSASATRAIVIDTLAPVVGINAVATDDVINAAEVGSMVSGTNEAGATVNLNLGGIDRAAIVSGTTWSYTLAAADITNMDQGAEALTATATGTAGNTASASRTITVDTLRPVVAIDVVASDDVINTAEVGSVISGTNEAGATVSLNLGGVTRVATVSGTSWSYTLVAADITTMGQGSETIVATVTDAAGNSASATRDIVIDTLPPVIGINVVATDDIINATEASGVISGTNEANDTVALNIGGTTRAATVNGTTWSYTLVAADITNMGQGAETLTATATGTAGNTASATRTITVDTLSPVIGINVVATDDIINAAEVGVVISGTNDALATVSLNLGGVLRMAVVSGSTWSYTLVAADIITMGQGVETITATATDVAGNTASVTRAIVIDTLPPAIGINVVATDDIINATEASGVISGTNESAATVSLSLGGTTRAATVNGTTWSYTLVAADITNMGQGAETLTASAIDAAGNSASATRAITVDTLAPVIGINVVASDDVINMAEATSAISGTNEAGATVSLNLGGVTRTATVSGTTWSYTLVAADIITMGQGAETITGTTTDVAGNGASTTRAILIDTLRPTATIVVTDTALKAGETSGVTIIFNEAVTGFANEDLTIEGGTLTAVASGDGGITWTATFTPTVDTTDTTNLITLTNAGVADAAGNTGVGTTTSNNYAIDTLRPTATIVVSDTALKVGETSAVTITFNEAVTGFANDDLTIEGDMLSAVTSGDGGITWTATFTPTADTTDASNLITLANTGITDAAGNAGTGTTTSNNYAIDTLRPTASIVVADTALKAGETSGVTITFNEAVTGFANEDLTIEGGTLSAVASGDGGITWTATFTPTADTTDASNLITLANTGITDAAGNVGVGVTTSNNYAIDTRLPTATIVVSDTALKVGETSAVTITFNEVVTGFANEDLTIEGGTLSAVASGDGGITWTATFTPTADTTDASNLITFANAGVTDVAGNAGVGVTTSNNYAIDTRLPTATIVVSDTALKVGETSAVTITFNEAVTGFANEDLTIEGGTLSAVASGDGGITWTATFTPTADTTDASNLITFANAGVTDVAGNAGVGVTTSNNYAIDTRLPTASIVVADISLKAGETSGVTITFNEAVTGFANDDLTIESGTLTAVASGDGGITWTATFTPTVDTTDASNLITLANTGITDAAGNVGVGVTTSNNYAIDTLRPTASIVVTDISMKAGETSAVTITFNEVVTGFANDDLTIEGGTLSAVASGDGGITWTATFTPTVDTTDASNLITLANTGITDAADNAGTGTTASNNYGIDTRLPTATIVVADSALKAGETSAVTITFNEAVAGLTNDDLTIEGGILTAVGTADLGITWTATFTPTADTTDASNLITLANTGVTDAAGNTGTGTTTSNNYAIDTLRPTASIVVTDTSLKAGETSGVTITFNEAVTGLANEDLTIEGGTLSAVASGDGGITWTATFTPTADTTDASNLIALAKAGVTDAAGNTGVGSTTSNNYAIDTLRPTASIVVTDTSLKAGETSVVTITFNEAVTGFANEDLTIEGGTLTAVGTADLGITWTATFTPTVDTTDATNLITLTNASVADAAGNAGTGTTNSNNYAIDTLRPTASIVVADISLKAGETSGVTITFNEAVTGFANEDLTIEGGTLSAVASGDGGITWTATFTPTVGITDTTNLITLTNTGLTDAAGNAGTGTTTSNNYAIDTLRPTASIVVTDTSLKAGETSAVTITFNEAVTGFANDDLTIEGGTLTAVGTADLGITWTATFTPTVDTTDATNLITLTNTGVTDAAGNAGTGTTASNNYAIDTLRPTATIVVADSALKAGETSAVTITFNEAVTGFADDDLTIEGGTLSAVASGDGGITWTATFTPTVDITDTTNLITLTNAGVADAAGNVGVGSTTSNNYAIDTRLPTATIVVSDTALKVGETSAVTITFNEAVTGFANEDLTVEGGTLSAVASGDGGITWTATFTPTADTTDASNLITLTNAGVADAAGNAGTGTTASNNYAIDTLRPTASIVVTDTSLKAGETSAVTITFNEAVTGLANEDLTIEGGTLTAVASGDGGITWTATFTPTAGITDTTNLITLANTGITDVAGNAGVGVTTSNNYAIDTRLPTATIVVSDTALKVGETSAVTITFNEAVTGFANEDLTIEGGTLSAVGTADLGITWTATFTPTVDITDTTNLITLTNAGVADAAGNLGTATTTSNNYAIDTLRPTASIVVTDTSLKVGETSAVTITFNEAVTGLTNDDLTIEGGTLSAVTSGDGGITWTATFTPTADTTDATNLITLTNAGVADAAGNVGVGTTISNNYAIDTRLPTATIVVSDTALKVGETSAVTITFNEAVTGFSNDDLTIEGGTLTAVGTADLGITWAATFTPTVDTTDASNLITLANTGLTDAVGNAGTGTTTSNNYAIDTLRPTASIVVTDTSLKAGETSGVTITFNEAVTGFANDDLTIEGGTLTAVGTADLGITWTATFTPTVDTTDASNLIALAKAGVTDAAGNTGVGSTTSNNYAIDTSRPTATIVVADTALKAGETSAVTITFNEAVTGFANEDLTIEGGTLSAVASGDGGITWTATFTPTADTTDATNLITLTNADVTDAAGNTGTGTTNSNNYAIDTLRPTASIVVADTALKAGETSGVTITFNEAVTGLANEDLTIEGGTLTAVGTADLGITWTATFTPTVDTTDTTHLITLTNAGVADAAGNAGVGTSASNNYEIDTLRPTATIVVADTALKAGETSAVTITFNEAVTGFANEDLTIEGGTLSAVASGDGGITWTATFTPTADTTDASNLVTLANTGITDAAGNAGVGSTTSNNYAIDTLRPTATIVVSDTALNVGETSAVTITFNEAVTGLTNDDLTIEGGTLSAVGTADLGITWTATFTPTVDTTDTTNLITLTNAGVADAAGNAGTGTTASNNYAIDTLRPTASIVVADTALKAGETSAVTITFNEAVTGLANEDLTIEGGRLSAVASGDGGITWTATFTPTADTTDASNLITLANTGITDAAGNTGTGTTTSNNYAIDTRLPTATIVVADSALKAGETSAVTITFNEAVTGLANEDLTIEGGTLSAVGTADLGITWTATFTPTADTTDASNLITLANTGVTDAAGNAGTGTTNSNNYAIDTLRPTASIVVADTALKAGETSGVTITFNEAVTGFANEDLTIEGGTLSAVASGDGGITWTATFTPTADTTDASNLITLANTGITDAAGNVGVGVTTSNNYAIDTRLPTATIVVSDTALKVGETSAVTITFNEAVTGFANEDLTIEGGTLTAVGTADLGITWTATFTPTVDTTDASNLITLANTGITDAAGNAGTGTTTSNNYAIDTLRPTASIVVTDTSLKAGETSAVTITFNEAVTGLANEDLTIEGGTLSAVASGDGGITWTATFTPTADTVDASNLITLANTGITDAAGNAGTGTTNSNNYAIDTLRPTASIVVADTALKAGETSGVTITFNEAVTGFSNDDLTIEGGTLSAVASGDGGITWTATFTPTADTTDATNLITLTNAGVADAAGNAGVGSTTSNNYAIDTLRPTASIVVTDTSLKAGETSGVTITFNEAVTGLANEDLTIEGGSLSAVASGDGGITWTATFTPTVGITDTTNLITLTNAGVADAAGNAGTGTTASNNYAIDTSAPTLTLSTPADEDTSVLVNTNIVLTFSENVLAGSGNIVISDGSNTLTIPVGDAQVSISGTTVTINPTTHLKPNAIYSVQMPSGVLVDAAGNPYAGITDSTTLNFTTGTDTMTINPVPGNLTIADSFWADVVGIDKIVITTTATGTQTINTDGIFQAAFAEGVELTTTSSTGTISIDMSSFTGPATLKTTSTTGNQTILTGTNADVVTLTTDAAAGNTVNTGAGNDTITIVNTGGANASAYTITGGLGADAINLDLAQVSSDTIVVGDADSGITLATADSITGFVSAWDSLKMGTAGTGGNFAIAGAAVDDFAAALAAANTALATLAAGAEQYSFQWDATNGYLFNDIDGDNTADQVVILVGIIGAEFAVADIVA